MANNSTTEQPRRLRLFFYLAALLPILLLALQYCGAFNMADIKNVIIIGAGGNLGPAILKTFLDSSFNVTVLSREGSNSTFPSGVKVLRADYDSPDSLKKAFQGQDAVISLVGGTALGDQNKLIDAAIAAGVKRFMPSEYGSNTPSARLREVVPVFNAKYSAVEYLKSKEDKISWSSVITGPFFDWGIMVGFLGTDVTNKTITLVDEGTTTVTVTNLHQIGLAVVNTLQNPALTKNQYVNVSSFQTTQRDVLAAAEKITGAKWTVKNTSSKELIETGNEKLKKQDFSGITLLIQAGAFGKEGLGNNAAVGPFWNEKLGLPKENFEESVKAGLEGRRYGE